MALNSTKYLSDLERVTISLCLFCPPGPDDLDVPWEENKVKIMTEIQLKIMASGKDPGLSVTRSWFGSSCLALTQ